MKSPYLKLLDSVRATLLPPAEQGITPGEVKQALVHILSPYFENQDVLQDAAIPALAPEAVNISKINQDPWAKEMLVNVLRSYREAARADGMACFVGFASWLNKILQASSEYVSLFNLIPSLDELSLYDLKYEAFRAIGAIIEANVQPYLRELLLQVRISRSKPNPTRGLETMDLGMVVNELFQDSGYGALFAPPPWGIRLNQWRNMAQHHSTRVDKGRIIGTYHAGSNEVEVTLGREELVNVLRRIQSILSLLKGAYSVFLIDHIDDVRPYIMDSGKNLRPDVEIFYLASSLATQGFDLRDIRTDEGSVTAVIQDVTQVPPNHEAVDYQRGRMVHCSQFVYVVWCYFPRDSVSINYLDRQGDKRCTITGKGPDCEAIRNGEVPFEELAARVVFNL